MFLYNKRIYLFGWKGFYVIKGWYLLGEGFAVGVRID